MKRARFTEEQIIGVLREHGTSAKPDQAWALRGDDSQLNTRFGRIEVSEAKRLRALEEENAELENLPADQMLDAAVVCESLSK